MSLITRTVFVFFSLCLPFGCFYKILEKTIKCCLKIQSPCSHRHKSKYATLSYGLCSAPMTAGLADGCVLWTVTTFLPNLKAKGFIIVYSSYVNLLRSRHCCFQANSCFCHCLVMPKPRPQKPVVPHMTLICSNCIWDTGTSLEVGLDEFARSHNVTNPAAS